MNEDNYPIVDPNSPGVKDPDPMGADGGHINGEENGDFASGDVDVDTGE